MSSKKSRKSKINKNSKSEFKEEITVDNQENKIKLIKRTLENNTHIVIEDTRLKSITSWRKSEKKFFQNLVFNLLSFGILHVISLYYPKLYLKLYCNPWPPKECDFFLVENIYGNFTLCSKIHKKSKNNNNYSFNTEISKNNIISSTINYSNKMDHYLIRNLTYSFKYKSVLYEYNEETNEISPVYMNLSKLTNKSIFNFFSEGLSSEKLIKKFEDRYGKNEYYINLGLSSFYFKKIEVLYLIFILIIEALNLIFKDPTSFLLFLAIIVSLFLIEFVFTKKVIYDLYKKEYTLDGEENKIKVKRRHKSLDNNNFFYEIKNCDLLPGDIIYLKSNDLVPCDCLILEGECIVNENSLNGSLDIFKKKSLENKNEQFNYELSKVNILYHGMKVIKTISKLKEGYISVLCINTGPNTYKANQLSNILYLFERKLEYKRMYEIFGEGRKIIMVLIITIFLLSILLGVIYIFSLGVNFDFKSPKIIKLLYITIIRLMCKSFMPVFFVTNSIIYFVGIFHLKNENILCFEKSKLTTPSKIDTIFFGKTGILCENTFEISGLHPIYINPHRPNSISYRTYKANQYKEMNSKLLQFYKDYLGKCQNITVQDFNPRHALRVERNQLNMDKINQESNECVTLFLECLLSCNNIEKFNTDIFGNSVETAIFKNMKWDIKSYRFNNENNKEQEINFSSENLFLNKNNSDNNKSYSDNNINIIDNNINDIYPNNYYKITESFNNEIELPNKPIITRFNSKFYLGQMKKKNSSNTNVSEFSITQNSSTNFIKTDISKSHIISYKLRIYKRFIKNGSLNSSSIVFNFITKELRFMTKGIPEDILDKCDKFSIPDNFDNLISLFRRKGYIIIVCASKIISIDDYKDTNPLDEYMNNLTFCGFITLKNKLKSEIINSIKDLRQFNCNLIISTGDNVFNCLPIGFDSSIIDNKNIFAFDKDDKKNRIIIAKIYSNKKETSDEEQDDKSINYDKISRHTLSNLSNKLSRSPMRQKELRSIRVKKEMAKNNDDFSLNQGDEENLNKEVYYEPKQITPNKNFNKQPSINKKYRETKNFIEFSKYNENEKNQKYLHFTDIKKDNDLKLNSKINNIITPLNLAKNKFKSDFKEIKEYQESSNTNRKFLHNNAKNKSFSSLEKFYFYPGIFEDYEELSSNCLYCISGKAFNFLYKNKEKRQCKKLLEKIHENCKIFFNMSSIDKSLAIDFYREYHDSCVCTIGKYPNDFDAMMTSNVGINLNPPKNENTILCHFYSFDSTILSIKKIIREGRTISENILLLKITSFFYSLILNSYILCCFMMEVGVINGQLNFLEICFLIFSLSAFTVQYDYNKTSSNPLIQNRKLYLYHYTIQAIGMFALKVGSIFLLRKNYIDNAQLERHVVYRIFITYYFILCVEQLFSTFFVFNYIYFYRKHPLANIFFVFFNLVIFIYFIILITLNSSNYRYDMFYITDFEFNGDLLDSFDDKNRINCFIVCSFDFCSSFIYSRIVFVIFDKLAKRKNIK